MRHLSCLWFPLPPTVFKFLSAEVKVLFVAMGAGIVALTNDYIPFILAAWPGEFIEMRKNEVFLEWLQCKLGFVGRSSIGASNICVDHI
jgi:hypothetical protein